MPSLYTLYRPKDFSSIIGQSHITDVLRAELTNNKISHAYLFVGPRGTGKTTTARVFAKAVNCLNRKPDGNPCNKCDICKAADAGTLLDIVEIDAASNRRIDEIRALKENVEYRPAVAKYKVYIIDEVHMLTREAFNALLKTLEEPPEHVIFILATTEPHKVPVTIASRCERFEFKLGGDKELTKLVKSVAKSEGIKIDDDAVGLLVEHAAGSYRDLLSLLDAVASRAEGKIDYQMVRSILGLPDETMVFYFISSLLEGSQDRVFSMLDEIFTKGVNLSQFLKLVIKRVRDILVGKQVEGYEFTQQIPRFKLTKILKLLVEAYESSRHSFDMRLPIQLAVLEILDVLGRQQRVEARESSKESVSSSASPDADNFKKGKGKDLDKEKVVKQSAPKKDSQEDKKYTPAPEQQKTEDEDKSPQGSKENTRNSALAGSVDLSSLSSDDLYQKIADSWKEFILRLKPYNGHLYAFLLQSKPLKARVNSNNQVELEIAVKFKFHKERIERLKSQKAVSDEAVGFFGWPLRLAVKVDEELFKVSSTSERETSQGQGENVAASPASRLEKAESSDKIADEFEDIFGDSIEQDGKD